MARHDAGETAFVEAVNRFTAGLLRELAKANGGRVRLTVVRGGKAC